MTPPSAFQASDSRPLSGPTSRGPSAVLTAIARRDVPTPGSTIPSATAYGPACAMPLASIIAPAWMSCGRHAVGQVDDMGIRGDARDDEVADADELVAQAQVGHEDDRTAHLEPSVAAAARSRGPPRPVRFG